MLKIRSGYIHLIPELYGFKNIVNEGIDPNAPRIDPNAEAASDKPQVDTSAYLHPDAETSNNSPANMTNKPYTPEPVHPEAEHTSPKETPTAPSTQGKQGAQGKAHKGPLGMLTNILTKPVGQWGAAELITAQLGRSAFNRLSSDSSKITSTDILKGTQSGDTL